MTTGNHGRAIALANDIYETVTGFGFERAPRDAVDSVISDLQTLRSLVGRCPHINIAIIYLERLKRPRFKKQSALQGVRDAAYAAKMMAYRAAE